MAAEMKAHGIPLFSLETKHPIGEFDMVVSRWGTK